MPALLLRPHVLAYKNSFVGKPNQLKRQLLLYTLLCLIMAGTYFFLLTFLSEVSTNPAFATTVPVKLISLSLSGFFLLLFFSATISAFGYFYAASDLPLLISTPVSPWRLYLARLIQTAFSASWLLFLFGLPAIAALMNAFLLPRTFAVLSLGLAVPFILIPATAGFIVITCLINIIPSHRVRELFAVFILLGITSVIIYVQLHIDAESTNFSGKSSLDALLDTRNPLPPWFPSSWISTVFSAYFVPPSAPPWNLVARIFGFMFAELLIGYYVFRRLFMRGWMQSLDVRKRTSVPHSLVLAPLGRFFFSAHPQFRAVLYKEARMFLRDPIQGIQLLLLLTLTAAYLYNFRALGHVPSLSPETSPWWRATLSVANVLLGGCVVSAITTRFVFPSISAEGSSYWILRAAPMTIRQILNRKFLTWLPVVSLISLILFMSGAWAAEAPPQALLATMVISFSLSIGTVGLAIGIGAVYGIFRWETIVQITASFGSLIYMLLSLGLLAVTTVPAAILLFLTNLSPALPQFEYRASLLGSAMFILLINVQAARWGLQAGELSLAERED